MLLCTGACMMIDCSEECLSPRKMKGYLYPAASGILELASIIATYSFVTLDSIS